MSPFEALYGYSPPQLALGSIPKSQVESVNIFLQDRQSTLAQLKCNLKRAQERMRKNEDKHRSERKFAEGDWVYLKLQPHRQITVAGVRNQKLGSKYYGPFEVVQRIGTVAYKLNLPPGSLIHPVFHVSQLKAKVGDTQVVYPVLPLIGPATNSEPMPQSILARRMVKKRNAAVAQILVQWRNQTTDDATWEDYESMAQRFPEFIREDTNAVKEGGMQREAAELGVTVGFKREEEGTDSGSHCSINKQNVPLEGAAPLEEASLMIGSH